MSDPEPQRRRICRPHGSFCVEMKYDKMVEAKFIERENRFVARVKLPDGEISRVHVKNTGRCRELLLPGADVYLEDHADRMGNRKLRYSLIAVRKTAEGGGQILINMDSQAPNKVVGEALADGRIRLPGFEDNADRSDNAGQSGNADQACAPVPLLIKPETRFGDSRFDFYVEHVDAEGEKRRAFIEVKGVTLEEGGHARFPDAPTERGVKHINELIRAHEEGYDAYIIFVVQMEGMKDVSPNYETHPQFGEALAKAQKAGVKILAYDCLVMPDRLEVKGPVSFKF